MQWASRKAAWLAQAANPAATLSAILMAVLAATLSAGVARAQACAAAGALVPPGRVLPHVAAALRPGQRLDVVAVGPATLSGPHLKPDAAFPARLADMLRAARPGADVRLVMHAERGASAGELLGILKREVAAHPGALVLWQSGTTEAARDQPPDQFADTLKQGVAVARAAGSDIVLIDPPFTRLLADHAAPDRYRDAFLAAANGPGAAVFSRFDLTRNWVAGGELDVERAAHGDRVATFARLHECLARALASGILAAAASTSP